VGSQRFDQVLFPHFASARDLQFCGHIAKLLYRPFFEGKIRITGTLRRFGRRSSFRSTSFVHSSGGDFLGLFFGLTPFKCTRFYMLVLASVFAIPFCHLLNPYAL
jgi:hypothetical protein